MSVGIWYRADSFAFTPDFAGGRGIDT